jgi:hypothetical protein
MCEQYEANKTLLGSTITGNQSHLVANTKQAVHWEGDYETGVHLLLMCP